VKTTPSDAVDTGPRTTRGPVPKPQVPPGLAVRPPADPASNQARPNTEISTVEPGSRGGGVVAHGVDNTNQVERQSRARAPVPVGAPPPPAGGEQGRGGGVEITVDVEVVAVSGREAEVLRHRQTTVVREVLTWLAHHSTPTTPNDGTDPGIRPGGSPS
jgi:hypothetical protein